LRSSPREWWRRETKDICPVRQERTEDEPQRDHLRGDRQP
jgi:hypothetical protein